MASTDEDCGHHLVMATSGEQSKGHMATSGEQCEGQMTTSGEQSEGQMATSGEQSEGPMATSGEQSEGHMDTSEPQGHLAISDVDMASSAGEIFTTEDDSGNSVVSSDEEPGGHLVLAGSAETEEDLELVSQPPVKRLRTGDHPSGGSQVANTLNIMTGQAGQGTLGRGTLDLRTDEAKKIFLQTEPYKDVKRKLKEFGHVTICGASGEGKTTMALVLGSQYRCKGYEVVFVDNIEKFDLDQCLSSHPRVFLIVDDMFGTVGLSANTSQVKSFLNNLLLHLEQKGSAEKLQSEMHESTDAVGKSRKKEQSQPEFQTKDSDAVGKSRKKVQSQPEFQTKDIRVVFTSKSYNFHDGLAKLQYEGFKLFKGQTVMDLTTQDKYWLSDKEKKTIFERHRKALGDCSMQHIPDYSELEICSNIFGFPLICKLCFEFSSFYKNGKSFFKEPLFYLRLELKRLLEERNDRSAILVLMLLCEDKLDLSKLDSEGEDKEMDSLVKTVLQMMSDATRSGMYKAAKGLRGTFFTRGDTVGFAHSSIYDACACALYNISPIFVLKHCSDDFLFERVQGDKVEETKVDDHLHLIYVSENYDDLLTTRFTQSIKQGQFSKSVTHPILKQDATVFKLLKKLHCDRTKHLWFHKKEKGQCFLYWAVLGHNARLITDIEHTTGEEFTQGEISEAMEGCAQSNNVTALKWLFSRSEKHDHQLTLNRLLLVAAESGSSDILVYLLQEGADINTRDKGMQNIFHLVCKSGLEKTLKVLLTRKPGNNVINSVDVNGRTPVMVAAHTGSEGCFKLLQTTSNLKVKDKHGSGIIHLACRGGNTAIVQHVLSPSNINSRGVHGWTAVMQAAVSGHQSVFDLVSNQADLTLVDTYGNSLLHLACQGGNTAIVQHVLSPSNINSRGVHGWTAVMQAAVSGHQSVFDLVSNQADLTLVDTYGNSLLHLACRGGNTAIVQHVLSPSNINSRGMCGYTPVMVAAFSGHQSVFDLLVSNQADLTLVDTYGDSLLHLACRGGNTAILQHVLSPSNINSRGRYGWTAAMKAAVSGHQSVFDLLVSSQADLTLVDADGDSLLHLACQGGNTAIVQHVLSPSNINSRGRYGWTAAMKAAVSGHQSVFDLLVSNQADLTLVDTYGDSLLHLACRGGNTAIVQHVMSPSNINSRGEYGWTAVMQAALNGHQSVFDLLVSNQADLTLVDTPGDSLLHLACRGGNTAIVQHVLSPSNINSRGVYGWTAVMQAALSGHQSVFDFLVSNQADLTLVAADGDSLLHLACHGGNTAIVKHVLSPSNINSRGRYGWTAAMKAAVNGHQSVFDLLVSNQADLTLVSISGDSLLHLACRGGNTAIVKHVLTPSNINSRGEYGRTAAMKAAVSGHQSVFDLLVSNQADLTLVDADGDSLLHLACQGGNTGIVQHVLSQSNINSRGRYGWTAAMKAAVTGHQSVFDLLVSNQADLTLVSISGDSLLHLACHGGNAAIVQHVLTPSNINSRGEYGRTAAMRAAVSGHQSVYDLLVSNQADLTLVDADGDSLLHLACQGGNTAIVKHVLTPSNINSRGEYGRTAAMKAAVNGHQSVFDLLVSNQADLTLVAADGDSLLHLACRGGNTAIVKHVLTPSNINSRGEYGRTAAMKAAVSGHQSVFDLLVSNQADLTLVDADGDSLLHLACQGGNTAIVKHVLTPSNINSRGEYGRTAAMRAAVSGHQSVYDLLVSNQADLTLVDADGDSLLHLACQGGNTAIVKHVLTPSNINSRGEYGRTAAMRAAVSGHQSVYDLLVSNQADLTLVDADGDSLLHLACQGGNTAIVKHVLTPSDINSRGQYGRTAAMKAAVNGHQSVFDLLVSNQADLTLVDADGDSLLHLACEGGNTAIVKHALTPSNINSRGEYGRTAAMRAAVNGHQSLFDLLVSSQADLTLVDADGDSLLHLACQGGNTAIVKHVLTPSDINSRGQYGWTAAMKAAVNGHQSLFDLLVSSQADLTLVSISGDSLLHLACEGGNTAIVKHVLTPSNINSRGEYGRTAAMRAAVSGHQSVYDLLVSNQADLTLVDADGDSLLHLACEGGNTAIVKHVLTPSNINSRGQYGRTAAMKAAVNGHQSVFDLLVSNQAELTLVDADGDSLLHLACEGGNTAIVKHALTPSNINSRGEYGRTAAMRAAVNGHQSLFDLLVSSQADLTLVDADGDSLLHLACQGGNTAIVQHVLSPSNINSRGRYGWTAAMKAAVTGHQSVFDLLVSNQADLTLVSISGDSLLHLACRGGNTAIVKHVLTPSDINSRGQYGWTAAMKAAVNGHQSLFDLLVSSQADLTLVSISGDSLLHLACEGGNTAIVKHVLTPSNINSRGEYGRTAAMRAAVSGHQSVYDLLVSNQADLTLVDADGDSLLHLACEGGNSAIVKHVLTPSNINSRGQYGRTAAMKAAVSGHQSVFDLLVSNQADLTLVDADGDSLLHLACEGGNTAIVKHALTPSNINSRGEYGRTAAMRAAVNGHQSLFDLLVSSQADLTLVDADGDSLLHLACQGGNTAIVQHVLSPSNINSRGRYGWTAAMKAAVTGHQSVFDLLVSNQADLTLVSISGDSLLHLACRGGNTAIVQHVLTPSNINSRGEYGRTAAMRAAVSGHQSVFDLLVSNQADLTLVDADGDSLLHLACRGGNTAIVQHVLTPSNINSRGEYGRTAAMRAAVSGHQSVFDLLVSNQADLTLVDADGDSLLHLACEGGNTAIVKHVLTPSNINSRGEYGRTAAMRAAVSGHQSVFDLLVSNQADLTLVDADGDSLLHLACEGGKTAIVKHVLTTSDINSRGQYGWTAAMKAAVNGHQSLFDLLVSSQADLTLVDADGDSLLHLACHGGNTAIVQHVLSPSNINIRGSEGYTPVMKAVFHGHRDVVDLLVQHKADLTLLTDSNEDIECVAQMRGHPTLAKYLQTVKHPH
ncbi:uncharacterized protein LOC125376312 isoform X2 [Haliotis rufescens]|uniref:uncharacterized protein LOC125376312 isoform X2 n=1 Tax=Haliotis rufescens TaxID=6454 RepID=UPI00201E8041|nr:uncharacterized protein LOC125376312 isoform X2 [Haliotis rufescens]